MTTPRALAESYWRAEERRDTDAVLDHFLADATFSWPDGTLSGVDAIRTFYDRMADDFPTLRVEVLDDVADGDRAAVAWRSTLTTADGHYAVVEGVNLIEVEDGRFRSLRVFYDTAQLARLNPPG